ncbi:MAG: hypothetical protein K2X77_02880 [Candidatus Obscuribacterales bacterium]|jgi:hypothetical protein|nr:hypothetical protein [Candidatus Obscuribacterales bacterium]
MPTYLEISSTGCRELIVLKVGSYLEQKLYYFSNEAIISRMARGRPGRLYTSDTSDWAETRLNDHLRIKTSTEII